MLVPKERKPIYPQPVKLNRLLLAEGDTPAHLFEALARHMDLHEQIEIRNYGGITQLVAYLGLLATTPDFQANVRSLAITRDAENDADAARRSAVAAVTAANLDPAVRVSYFIFPDGANPGMIETLCVRAVEAQPHFECVTQFFECLIRKGVQLPDGPILAKHQAQVYLATQKNTQMMPGVAGYQGAWPFADSVFDSLRAFLQDL